MAELPVSYPNQRVPFEQIPESNAGVGVGASVVGQAAGAFGQLAQSMRKADMANKLSVLDMQLSKASGDARIAAEQADPAQAGNVYDAAIGQYRQKYVDSINDPELQREAALRLNAQASNDIPSVHYRAVQKMADVSKDMLANDLQIQGQNYLNADSPAHQMEAEQRIRDSFNSRVGILFTPDQARANADMAVREAKDKSVPDKLLAVANHFANSEGTLRGWMPSGEGFDGMVNQANKSIDSIIDGTNVTPVDARRRVFMQLAEGAADQGRPELANKFLALAPNHDENKGAEVGFRADLRQRQIADLAQKSAYQSHLGNVLNLEAQGADMAPIQNQIRQDVKDNKIEATQGLELLTHIKSWQNDLSESVAKQQVGQFKQGVYGAAANLMDAHEQTGGAGNLMESLRAVSRGIPGVEFGAKDATFTDIRGNEHKLSLDDITQHAADRYVAGLDAKYQAASAAAKTPEEQQAAMRDMLSQRRDYFKGNDIPDHEMTSLLNEGANFSIQDTNSRDGKPAAVPAATLRGYEMFKQLDAVDPVYAASLMPQNEERKKLFYRYAQSIQDVDQSADPTVALGRAAHALNNKERHPVNPITNEDMDQADMPFSDAKNAGSVRSAWASYANVVNSEIGSDKQKALSIATKAFNAAYQNINGYAVPIASTSLSQDQVQNAAKQAAWAYAGRHKLNADEEAKLTVRPFGGGAWVLVNGEDNLQPVDEFIRDGTFDEAGMKKLSDDYRNRIGATESLKNKGQLKPVEEHDFWSEFGRSMGKAFESGGP